MTMIWFINIICIISLSKGSIELSDSFQSQCNQPQQPADYPLIRLPRIDLLKYTKGTIRDRQEVVISFKRYLHEYQTLSLYHHEIPFEILDNLTNAGLNFHRRSDEYKLSFSSQGLGTPGFDKLKTLRASYSYGNDGDSDGDYTEMFAIFNHQMGIPGYSTYYPLKEQTPNELYDITRLYIPHIRRVLKTVHHIASEALLGFNKTDFFEDRFKDTPHLQLRSFYYPEMNQTQFDILRESDKYRISEHNDYLGFSLFLAGTQRGLQNKIGGKENGLWMDCKTDGEMKYDIFVNTGELFSMWTNDYWQANWHRVILQKEERVTFTYFGGPDQELMIKPIEGCDVCTKDKPKYVERTAAQHAQLRFTRGDTFNGDGDKFYSDSDSV